MALLLRDREGAPEVAAQPPAGGAPLTALDFACHACGADMKAGQDWCLECGTAAPGRLGARPGWRAAFTVVAVTLLLVVGAVAASYAALTSDAERSAAAPSTGDGQPIAAVGPTAAQPAAPIAPGATGPGTAAPVVPPPTGTPIIPVVPPKVPANTPVTPPVAKTPPPAAKTPPPAAVKPSPSAAGAKPAEAVQAKPEIIDLKAGSASTYDPAKRPGAEFGPASSAIDKSPNTVWDVTVPADGKPIAAGLLLDLGKPYALRALTIATPAGGYEIEIYGAVSAKQKPEDILDKRWEHLTDIKKVTDGKIVSLLGKSEKKHQLLLLYVTTPTDQVDPLAAIGDVKLAGTP